MLVNVKELKAALSALKMVACAGFHRPTRVEATAGKLDLRVKYEGTVLQICLGGTPDTENLEECFVRTEDFLDVCSKAPGPTIDLKVKGKKDPRLKIGDVLMGMERDNSDGYKVKGMRGKVVEIPFETSSFVNLLDFLCSANIKSEDNHKQLGVRGDKFFASDGHRLHVQGGMPLLSEKSKSFPLEVARALIRTLRFVDAEKVYFSYYPEWPKKDPGFFHINFVGSGKSVTVLARADDCSWGDKIEEEVLLPIDERSQAAAVRTDVLKGLLEQAKTLQKEEGRFPFHKAKEAEVWLLFTPTGLTLRLMMDEKKNEIVNESGGGPSLQVEVPVVRSMGADSARVGINAVYVLEAIKHLGDSVQLISTNQIDSSREPLVINGQVPYRFVIVAPVYDKYTEGATTAIISASDVRKARQEQAQESSDAQTFPQGGPA